MHFNKELNMFSVGKTYFLLHYLDFELEFPVITSVVFIGKNLEPDLDKEDLWFFQDSISYLNTAPCDLLNNKSSRILPKQKIAGEIYDFPEQQLPNIFTGKQLAQQLFNTSRNSRGSSR